MKWFVELTKFDIVYESSTSVKDQALVDFIVEFTNALDIEMAMEPADPLAWNLFVDGYSGQIGAGTEVV